MVRYACAACIVAGLTGCVTETREVPVPVPVEKECPTVSDRIPTAFYFPVRELGRREVSARGGRNRDLISVMVEMEGELKYCNIKLEMIREAAESE